MKNHLPYCSRNNGIINYNDSKVAKTEKNDCVVVTIASCFDISYDRAHKFCKDYFNRQDGQGTHSVPFKMNNFYNTGKTLNYKKVKPMGKKIIQGLNSTYTLDYEVKVKGIKQYRRMTVGTFIKQNPKGTFFMLVERHAFTIKDGIVIGNLQDAQQKRKHVHKAWEIK